MRTAPLLALLLPLWLAACSKPEPLPPDISAARLMLAPPGASIAAGYFELRNPGQGALELLRVSSPAFESVEMHETVEVDGLSRMRAVESVNVPAGGTVSFEPGGKHLMLMGPRIGDAPPAELPLTLELRGADGSSLKVDARFAVEQAGGPQEPDSGHEHHDHHHDHAHH